MAWRHCPNRCFRRIKALRYLSPVVIDRVGRGSAVRAARCTDCRYYSTLPSAALFSLRQALDTLRRGGPLLAWLLGGLLLEVRSVTAGEKPFVPALYAAAIAVSGMSRGAGVRPYDLCRQCSARRSGSRCQRPPRPWLGSTLFVALLAQGR